MSDIIGEKPLYDGEPGKTAQLGNDSRYRQALGMEGYRDDARMMIRAAAWAVRNRLIPQDPNERLPTHFDDPAYVSSVGEILSPSKLLLG